MPWQKTIAELIVQDEADDRTIYYLWDTMGCSGKTWLARHLTEQYPERVLNIDYRSSRHATLAVLEAQERLNGSGFASIIIIDIPRALALTTEFFVAAETIKGGNFQSSLKPIQAKTMQCFLHYHPHVLVVTNEQPSKEALGMFTPDRWKVFTINPDTQEAVLDRQSEQQVQTITNDRYKAAMRAIAGNDALDADPNKTMVRECFVVDATATAELAVMADLLPVMEAAGFTLSHINLGMLLTAVFAKEIADGTVKTKKGGKKGSRYSGLRII